MRDNICPSFDSRNYKASPPLFANCDMVHFLPIAMWAIWLDDLQLEQFQVALCMVLWGCHR